MRSATDWSKKWAKSRQFLANLKAARKAVNEVRHEFNALGVDRVDGGGSSLHVLLLYRYR